MLPLAIHSAYEKRTCGGPVNQMVYWKSYNLQGGSSKTSEVWSHQEVGVVKVDKKKVEEVINEYTLPPKLILNHY